MFLSTSRGLFAGALLCSSACSWADSKPVHGESLSLHQAISRTLLSNPELAAAGTVGGGFLDASVPLDGPVRPPAVAPKSRESRR